MQMEWVDVRWMDAKEKRLNERKPNVYKIYVKLWERGNQSTKMLCLYAMAMSAFAVALWVSVCVSLHFISPHIST